MLHTSRHAACGQGVPLADPCSAWRWRHNPTTHRLGADSPTECLVHQLCPGSQTSPELDRPHTDRPSLC